jgi:hypothetical protein
MFALMYGIMENNPAHLFISLDENMVVSFDVDAFKVSPDMEKPGTLSLEISKNRLAVMVSSGMKCSIKSENHTPRPAVIRQVQNTKNGLILTCDLCNEAVETIADIRK